MSVTREDFLNFAHTEDDSGKAISSDHSPPFGSSAVPGTFGTRITHVHEQDKYAGYAGSHGVMAKNKYERHHHPGEKEVPKCKYQVPTLVGEKEVPKNKYSYQYQVPMLE